MGGIGVVTGSHADRLHVSIDASAVPTRPRGAGRYVIELVHALTARDDLELTIWCRRDDASRFRPDETTGVPAARTRSRVTTRPVVPIGRPTRIAFEQAVMPGLLDRSGAAVHHGPHYTMPERAKLPKVVTVHDLTFFDHPEWHERSKVLLFRRAIRQAVNHARAIVCVSQRTADRLEELFSPAGPVVVVPHGVDHKRFSPEGDPEEDRMHLERYGVREPYVAFVGTIEPRKAVSVLVEAFGMIGHRVPDLQLVLLGAFGWGSRQVHEAIARSPFAGRIMTTGYVDDDDLPSLLRRASVVAYPSLEEGFGLPALEALASGTPLVTTKGSVMAEMAAGAAFEAEKGTPEELARALEAALAGGFEVSKRVLHGLEVADAHTWEASAARHVEVYRLAASAQPSN
jgi:glycosyltransferase involved in cell wall biosynthesis